MMIAIAPGKSKEEQDENLSDEIQLDDEWLEEKNRSKRKNNPPSDSLDEEYLAQ